MTYLDVSSLSTLGVFLISFVFEFCAHPPIAFTSVTLVSERLVLFLGKFWVFAFDCFVWLELFPLTGGFPSTVTCLGSMEIFPSASVFVEIPLESWEGLLALEFVAGGLGTWTGETWATDCTLLLEVHSGDFSFVTIGSDSMGVGGAIGS